MATRRNSKLETGDDIKTFEGSSVKRKRLASGIPLVLDADQEAILLYEGSTDISDRINEEPGTAIYLKFSDGKKLRSMSRSFALQDIDWTQGKYYYLNNTGEIEMGNKNPMRDIIVEELGEEGNTLKCAKRISKSGTLILTEDHIAIANYTSDMNFPDNPSKNFSQVEKRIKKNSKATGGDIPF